MSFDRPDPFDDPEGYLAHWVRWPPERGLSYFHQMVREARDFVSFRKILLPTPEEIEAGSPPLIEAFLALETSQRRANQEPPKPRGRPKGEISIETAFARDIVRWAVRMNVLADLEPLEVMALAVMTGVQPIPPKFKERAGSNRRDQRRLCKDRWRVVFREAKALAAADPKHP